MKKFIFLNKVNKFISFIFKLKFIFNYRSNLNEINFYKFNNINCVKLILIKLKESDFYNNIISKKIVS